MSQSIPQPPFRHKPIDLNSIYAKDTKTKPELPSASHATCHAGCSHS